MRLLFLSNYYPPAAVGGYEQWCQEVAEALAERGHHVSVITSHAAVENSRTVPVHRVIELEVVGDLRSTIGRLRRRQGLETATLTSVEQLVDQIQPDAALIWGMWNVPRSVPALVEHLLPERTAYYFCDYWPTLPSAFAQQLGAPARRGLAALPKRLIAKALQSRLPQAPPLMFQRPICVSQAVRRLLVEAGIPVSQARVLYGGTDLLPAKTSVHTGANVRLLYLGRLTPEKGAHTALAAMRILGERALTVHLDVYGQGDPAYARRLALVSEKHNLSPTIHFRGSVSGDEVPALFGKYDALIFPSEWQEPFSRTVIEAMAANLLVIGTTTGGTGEVLREGETGLIFKAGDAYGLADQIECLARDGAPFRKLTATARETVAQHFSLNKMVDQFEETLSTVSNPTLTSKRVTNI